MAVTAEVKDRVGWITMDRPPANAYDAAFLEELDRCVGEVAEAEAVVAVIRSASEKFFSAGADVKGYLERPPVDSIAQHRRAQQVLGRFADEAPLFIAAIAGHALGGGYEIALACDIRIAAEGRYRIGLPEVTYGLLPGTGGTQRLPRLIGRGRALELMTTGRTVTPAEAERLGMVDRLVPAGQFDKAVTDLAAAWPPAPPWPWPPSPEWSTTGWSAPWATPSRASSRSWQGCSPPRTPARASPPTPRSEPPGSSAAETAAARR
jgi:enoyl-CoA hydratase/carnithine racemase